MAQKYSLMGVLLSHMTECKVSSFYEKKSACNKYSIDNILRGAETVTKKQ